MFHYRFHPAGFFSEIRKLLYYFRHWFLKCLEIRRNLGNQSLLYCLEREGRKFKTRHSLRLFEWELGTFMLLWKRTAQNQVFRGSKTRRLTPATSETLKHASRWNVNFEVTELVFVNNFFFFLKSLVPTHYTLKKTKKY